MTAVPLMSRESSKSQSIHPFFVKSNQFSVPSTEKRAPEDSSASRSPSPTRVLASPEGVHRRSPSPCSNSRQETIRDGSPVALPEDTASDLRKASHSAMPAVEIVVNPPPNQSDALPPATSQSLQPGHIFFSGVYMKNKTVNDASLDEDLNIERRKRRRTGSPESSQTASSPSTSQTTVFDSETASCNKDQHSRMEGTEGQGARLDLNTSPVDVEMCNIPSSTGNFIDLCHEDPKLSKGFTRLPLPGSAGSSHALSRLLDQKQKDKKADQAAIDDLLDERPGPSQQQSPPKKMLGLTASGKLTSPVTKSSATKSPESQSIPTSRGRSKRVSGKKRKGALVVKISYATDASAKDRIAQEIEEILNAPEVHKVEPSGTETTHDKPAKPTHPFFLGKAERADSLAVALSVMLSSSTEKQETASGKVRPTETRTAAPNRLSVKSGSKFNSAPSASFSSQHHSEARKSRVLGTIEPSWPSKEMMHVRALVDPDGLAQLDSSVLDNLPADKAVLSTKKLKGRAPRAPPITLAESVLTGVVVPFQVKAMEEDDGELSFQIRLSRPPERVITTGKGLQQIAASQIRRPHLDPGLKPEETKGADENTGISHALQAQRSMHRALQTVYDSIGTNLAPFDRAECETESWTQKYAPSNAAKVLQVGPEARLLRDWLSNLTVVAVESGQAAGKAPGASRGNSLKPRKKRKRKDEELDDFIISSGDEEDELSQITDGDEQPGFYSKTYLSRKSVIRSGDSKLKSNGLPAGRFRNAIVISGPHGCGKTAAAYAVAKELGFQVFEINSGSRRNGKDILDKVGNMTRNHLVHRNRDDQSGETTEDEAIQLTDTLREEIETGRQATMKSFFQAGPKQNKQNKQNLKPSTKTADLSLAEKSKPRSGPQHAQTQSLILFEEVDILFEEDKNFWVTVISLMAQSRRPIIMTCNDESRLPLEELSLHAILRLEPPPKDLAVDYLLLIAANEGHILDREAIQTLYDSKGWDLRASIMEMDFWCQMCVGDTRGGLDWMHERWVASQNLQNGDHLVRVASKDTYRAGLGRLDSSETAKPDVVEFSDPKQDTMAEETREPNQDQMNLLWEAWDSSGIDVDDWSGSKVVPEMADWMTDNLEIDPSRRGEYIRIWDAYYEGLSAGDVFAGRSLSDDSLALHDASQPVLSEKSLLDVVQGETLLSTEPLLDLSGLSTHLALEMKIRARETLYQHFRDFNYPDCPATYLRTTSQETESYLRQCVLDKRLTQTNRAVLTPYDLSHALSPLAEPVRSPFSNQPGNLSCLHRPAGLVAQDIAPYVRSIVSFDQQLEDQRRRLSNLMSQGGRNGKTVRTTRASRSALEGGARSSTRRERWFDNKVNPYAVLRTGGEAWGDAAREMAKVEVTSEEAEEEGVVLSGQSLTANGSSSQGSEGSGSGSGEDSS